MHAFPEWFIVLADIIYSPITYILFFFFVLYVGYQVFKAFSNKPEDKEK